MKRGKNLAIAGMGMHNNGSIIDGVHKCFNKQSLYRIFYYKWRIDAMNSMFAPTMQGIRKICKNCRK